MKKFIKQGLAATAVFGAIALSSSLANAAIMSVAGGTISTDGSAFSAQSGEILASPPAAVLDDNVFNTHQQGFDEKQGVLLGAGGVITDQGAQGQNMRVDSHMIFLNSQGQNGNQSPWDIKHYNVAWTFSGAILGVMSNTGGSFEANSSGLLGAAGTTYPSAFNNRGLEGGGDGYSILGNMLTLDMHVTEPGDWIRVVTVSAVPLPAALPLYGAGVALLGFLGWRKRRSA